jgi:hypothetical protein
MFILAMRTLQSAAISRALHECASFLWWVLLDPCLEDSADHFRAGWRVCLRPSQSVKTLHQVLWYSDQNGLSAPIHFFFVTHQANPLDFRISG